MAYSQSYVAFVRQLNNPQPQPVVEKPVTAPKPKPKKTKKAEIVEEKEHPKEEMKDVHEVPHMDESPPDPPKKKKITIIRKDKKTTDNKKDVDLEEDVAE